MDASRSAKPGCRCASTWRTRATVTPGRSMAPAPTSPSLARCVSAASRCGSSPATGRSCRWSACSTAIRCRKTRKTSPGCCAGSRCSPGTEALPGPGRRGAPPVPIAGREGRMAFASSCARTSFGPCSIWAPARRRRSRRAARRCRDTARSAFRWRTFGLAENPTLRVDLKLCSGNRVRPMLEGFHPSVRTWFEARFGTPTEPQALGWPCIQRGEPTLIAALTGYGKTLAAFLACLDAMIREGDSLRDAAQVLYVSLLKALANDVRMNLLEPLAELRRLPGVPEIRTAVRTGDTPQPERQAMLRKPPHVLATTPESFFLLLTSEGGRKALRTVRTVIVDEIHAVARDKRGAHLALSLERLDALCARRCVRVGLSATQKPIEEIGRFLTGGRPCAIVESGSRRALDVAIEVPRDELGPIASKEQREEMHDRVAQLVREHRTTLVFVNTRRQVERVAHALGQRLGEDQVVAHHGSLSRPVRLLAEEKLKQGLVRCAVATASLELGIDVGAVELVVQLESPRSLSVALQRVGRASHHRGGVPKGRLFPVTRDQLVECAALVRGMRAGALEITRIPEWPRDVLAQQLVAMAACEDLAEDAAYELVKRAWPYRDLPRSEFDAVIEMHAEGVARRAGRAQGARLHRDGANKVAKARRGSRLAAITSGGASPETAQCAVVAEAGGVTMGQD